MPSARWPRICLGACRIKRLRSGLRQLPFEVARRDTAR
jgi:hypothetical protein